MAEELKKECNKLKEMQKSLNSISYAVNKEIMQTDVEWMNLVAIVKKMNKKESPKKKMPEKPQAVSFDAPQGSLPPLDLQPSTSYQNTRQYTDEEFDSD